MKTKEKGISSMKLIAVYTNEISSPLRPITADNREQAISQALEKCPSEQYHLIQLLRHTKPQPTVVWDKDEGWLEKDS